MSGFTKARVLVRSFFGAIKDIALEVRLIKAPYWVAMVGVAAVGDALTWLVK